MSTSSVAISGNQWQSVAISGNQLESLDQLAYEQAPIPLPEQARRAESEDDALPPPVNLVELAIGS